MTFLTVPQAVKKGPVSRAQLRRMISNGTAPGYFAGTRFYVNYDRLLEMLNESTSAQKAESGEKATLKAD